MPDAVPVAEAPARKAEHGKSALAVTGASVAAGGVVAAIMASIKPLDSQDDPSGHVVLFVVFLGAIIALLWGQVLALRTLHASGRKKTAWMALALGALGLSAGALTVLLTTLQVFTRRSFLINACYLAGLDFWVPPLFVFLGLGLSLGWLIRKRPRRVLWAAAPSLLVALAAGLPWAFVSGAFAPAEYQDGLWRGHALHLAPEVMQEAALNWAKSDKGDRYLEALIENRLLAVNGLRACLAEQSFPQRGYGVVEPALLYFNEHYPDEAARFGLDVMSCKIYVSEYITGRFGELMATPERAGLVVKALDECEGTSSFLMPFMVQVEDWPSEQIRPIFNALERNCWAGREQRDSVVLFLSVVARRRDFDKTPTRRMAFYRWHMLLDNTGATSILRSFVAKLVEHLRPDDIPARRRAYARVLASFLEVKDLRVLSPCASADGQSDALDGAEPAPYAPGEEAEIERVVQKARAWLDAHPDS